MSSIKNVKISVRHLVEFVLRSGDLISVFTGSSRLVDGGKIHRKLQQSQGTEYRAEVSLSLTVERPGVILQIGGRADGVIITRDEAGDEQVTVDEIKSISAPLETIGQGHNPQHWAQAKCYAFIYAQQEGLREITVQLTYCQAATLEIKTFQHRYSVAELAAFFDNLVTQYAHWAARIAGWTEIRDTAARRVEFPFASFRAGQRQLAVAVYKTLSAERKLFAQAPTGTGKTMAAIFPAIKALGRGTVERIFYLTAKTVTRQLAEEAFKRLRQAGLRLKTVTLTAKEKICFLPGAACTPEECPYAQGYYDRIGQALTDCWELEAFTREMIEEQARRHRLCPFAFSLDLAWWADTVICDYNYVFDPGVYLKRFFDENSTGNCLLVDEAHNLVDRAREMFSAEITKQPFLALKKRVRERLPGLAKNMGKINSFLGKTGKLCREKSLAGQPDYWVGEQPLTEINPLLREFLSLAEAWLTYNEPADFRQELLDLYFAVYAFLRTAELYDARYVTYAEKGEKDVKLTYFCVDPSHLLRQAAARGRTAVFFSATLAPLDYFGEMLGGEGEDGKIAVPSPFARENLCLLVANRISTAYKAREYTYDAVVDSVTAAIGARNGNYLVFLPSYRYLEEVYQRFCLKNPDTRTMRQSGEMTEEERTAFLAEFAGANPDTLVGFAVTGGIFGEGIDLAGECLLGAVVVGVGLPQVCLEREIIRQWFDGHGRRGFEYAYMFPGMNKVLQAAGRVIRTEKDRGMVLLIDDRFSQARYRKLFPGEWRGAVDVKNAAGIAERAIKFWAAEE